MCNFSLTVDQKLTLLKALCRHITFMPKNPDNYGSTFWVQANVETKYVARIVPCLCAQERKDRENIRLPEYAVTKLKEKLQVTATMLLCKFLHATTFGRKTSK